MGENEIRKGLRERDHIDPGGASLPLALIGLIPFLGDVVNFVYDAYEEARIPHPYIVDTNSRSGDVDPEIADAVQEHLIEISSIPTEQYGPYFDGMIMTPEMSRHFANINYAAQALGMTDMEFVASIHDRTEQSAAVIDDAVGHRTTEAREERQRQAVANRARQTAIYNEQIDQHWNRVLGLLPGGMGLDVESDLGNAPPKESARDNRLGLFDDLEGNLGLVSAAASDLAPATNALDDTWAHFREQGGAPSFSPEGIEYGVWGFERSLAQTRDLTSHLREAAADAPWASYREQGQAPDLTDEGLARGAWSLEDSQAHTRDWTSSLPDATGTAGGGLDDLGDQLTRTSNFALRMQDTVAGASFELHELENPLLQTRDGAIGLADAMGGHGGYSVTGAMDGAGLAADGLALSTGTAEQALLAAGLTGDSTTQVLDLMRSAGLDPATSAWGELATAVHVWGDATDTEVGRVIGRLGELASVQGGGGPGSGGSGGGGGADDRTQRGLDQLMALAHTVAVRRADMGDLNPQHIAHELGKLPGQLRGPGSLEEKLALLRLFFAGGAHGISFGLGPSASDLGVNIPQFAGGGTVPGPLGAPQLIVAHGGEHIVPHRATGSPTIIRIELDREVLSQAVLGDLLRLQGREVTLGLS